MQTTHDLHDLTSSSVDLVPSSMTESDTGIGLYVLIGHVRQLV